MGRNSESDQPAVAVSQVRQATVREDEAPKAEPTRTERLARMDQKLLSYDLMRDISAKADRERKR